MERITDFVIAYYPFWFVFWMGLCTVGCLAERKLAKHPNQNAKHAVSIASSLAGALAIAPFIYLVYDTAPIGIKPILRGIGIIVLLVLPILFVYLTFAMRKNGRNNSSVAQGSDTQSKR